MNQSRLKNSLWFALLSFLILVGSIFFAKELQQADNLISILEENIDSFQTPSSPAPSTLPSESALSATNSAQSIDSLPTSTQSAQLFMVTKVIDGDTIEIETGQKVRYIGIDTPELHHPQKKVECFSQQADEANKKLVEGKRVKLVKDISEIDRFGRLLRYVWVDDIFVNEKLVQEGFAYASSYPPDVHFQEVFRTAQEIAKLEKKGLWGSC